VSESFDNLLISEARTITQAAREAGVRLRLLGALAIYLHSADWKSLAERLNRLGNAMARFTDLDFAAYGNERHKVRTLLEDGFGLRANAQALLFHGKERLLYHHPTKGYHVDVFFDRLRFSHTIELGRPGRGRLDMDFPTLSPADLLLSKLQIHRFTDKDAKDVILLLRAHPIRMGEEGDVVNVARVVEPLSEDWGFWKDATTNLARVREEIDRLTDGGVLAPADAKDVHGKVTALLKAIDTVPKSRSWRKGQHRLADGRWWDDVEDVVR